MCENIIESKSTTHFIHFLPESLSMSEGINCSADSLKTNTSDSFNYEGTPFPNKNMSSRPKTRRRTPPAETIERENEDIEKETDGQCTDQGEELQALTLSKESSLKSQLFLNFQTAKLEIAKLRKQTQSINSRFEVERAKLLATIHDLESQVERLKQEKGFQKESYMESLQEIEEKSARISTQLTNTLIENACLR